MASTVGVRVTIEGDASGAKRAVDEASASIAKLNSNAKDLPPFMGSGALPGFNANARYVPPLTQPSPYGINSFYGQTSPGGIFPDGRRVPNTDQKIAQLTDQLAKLGETIKDVNQDLQEARDKQDIKSEYQLSGTLNNLKATESQIKNELNGLEREKEKDDKNSAGNAIAGYMSAHLATQVAQMFVAGGNTLIDSRKALAGGNALESEIMKDKGIGGLLGGGAGTLIGAIIGSFGGPIGTLAGAGIGGTLGRFFGELFGNLEEIDAAFSGQYKKALPSIESFYQRYGVGIDRKTGEQNSKEGLEWYNKASEISMGTGKTPEELMEAARGRGAYGNISAQTALTGARDDVMWERFTGANLGNIQRMAGLSMRYGGDEKAMQYAYAGLTASGMGKGQFDEFLTSMQRIMEDSIQKGFMKGANEIAGNMTLLSKLSGGSALWTGEQGANRLMNMNEATANATGLKGVEDVVSFSVARDLMNDMGNEEFKKLTGGNKTNTYVDSMMLLERGVSADLLKGQFNAVRDMEGNNPAGQIERFMKMYNLSYTGGKAVYDMALKSANWTDADWKKAEKDIKEFQVTPGMESDSQNLQDIMTKINTSLVNIGKIKFDSMEIPKLTDIAGDVHNILARLMGEHISVPLEDFNPRTDPESDRPGRARDHFVRSENSDDPVFTSFQNAYKELTDPYMADARLFNNLMGNGNIAEFSRYLDEAKHGGIDSDEAETLMRLFRGAIEDFRRIIDSFNNRNSTSFALPDNISVVVTER